MLATSACSAGAKTPSAVPCAISSLTSSSLVPACRTRETRRSVKTRLVDAVSKTTSGRPIVASIDQTVALIVGGTDGSFHALKANTGEPIWHVDVSKRAILNSVLYRNGVVYLSHGEENIGTTEMGMIAAIDARRKGALKDDAFRWKTLGFLPTFASPVMDEGMLYTVDNSGIVERSLDMQAKMMGGTREEVADQLSGALPLLLNALENPAFQEKVAVAASACTTRPTPRRFGS